MSKLINISDDVYKELTMLKAKQSYSEIIRKLLEKKSNKEHILKFFGKGEFDDAKLKDLKEGWKRWSKKYV